MKQLLLLLSVFGAVFFNDAQNYFQTAYNAAPLVPKGLLESVAWNTTRMQHLANVQEGCSGIPTPYGIMGLHDDGKNYFIKNGEYIAALSGISINDQKLSAANQIMSYALACQVLFELEGNNNGNAIRNVLHQLSEIPEEGIVNNLARDMQVYSVLVSLNDDSFAQKHNFSVYHFNLASIFGAGNYTVLSSPKIQFTSTEIKTESNVQYSMNSVKSTEYGPAIWTPAPTCNFSSRSGVAISAITIHTIQGTYAGAISWSQNCSSSVSYHYVVRSSDGQVTQMVLEEDKAWHVGSENPYTIGYEHDGYVNDPVWYTDTLYASSAAISRDIVNSGYGIPALRTYYGPASTGTNVLGNCTKIKGHQHFPNQSHTDPGINWNWEKYYRLINNDPVINTLANPTDPFYDTGGSTGNYQDDEREIWVIEPNNVQSVTINFSSFELESGFDHLFIYDGNSIDSPLIGQYTGTNSPGTITSTAGALTIEFRSDCATAASGWEANYTSIPSTNNPPVTNIVGGVTWQTDDFQVQFNDTDIDNDISNQFYLVAEKEVVNTDWVSNGTFGFAYEEFNNSASNWIDVNGVFTLAFGAYSFNDVTNENSNSSMMIEQNSTSYYLYSWEQTIMSSESNQRAGMHFFCSDINQTNRGNSYFIFLRETDNKAQIYSVDNNIFNLEIDVNFTINAGQTYFVKTIYNPTTGLITLYIDNQFIANWTDPSPLISGNAISLRTAGCEARFDNIHVYKSRGNMVSVGAGLNKEMSIESENATPTGKIISTVVDSLNHWSAYSEETYLLDFTAPVIIEINDGSTADIDTLYNDNLEANWSVNDIHSDIANYQVAVGTLPNTANVVPWTNNGLSSVYSTILASPVFNEVYYVSIIAENQAGLTSFFISDGQLFQGGLSLKDISPNLESIDLFPNPANAYISFKNLPGVVHVSIYDMSGKKCKEIRCQEGEKINISTLANGQYSVMIQYENTIVLKKLVLKR